LLYSFIKIIARLAIKIYCRNIIINKKEFLQSDGPLLLAANHPNSFLDAIILCTLFDQPIYSLARGDAFKNNFFAKILFTLKLLPVYRISEGAENVTENYKTFGACKNIFKQNGIVLIFSEGLCVNEWHLRPLKKGTARLALSCWQDGIPIKVLPVAINYSSFKKFGKNVQLFFGDCIGESDFDLNNVEGKNIQSFNAALNKQLQPFVFEINKADSAQLQQKFYFPISTLKRIILFLPATIGWLLHAPFYYPIKFFVQAKSKDADHYDSIMVGILLLLYPLFMVMWFLFFFKTISFVAGLLAFCIIPFCAWAYVQLKRQTD
jgi:1-acyl-sn-glycerol-3-phosphate acyltransferase